MILRPLAVRNLLTQTQGDIKRVLGATGGVEIAK